MDFNEARLDAVRSRSSIFLIAVTSFALSFSALGMAPAGAIDSEPPADSWQAAAAEASASSAELISAFAEGDLVVEVIREVNGDPVFTAVKLATIKQLEAFLFDARRDPSIIAIDQVGDVRAMVLPTYSAEQWSLPAINANSDAVKNSGVNIKVAVIDSGVDSTNPDLNSGQVLDGVDYFSGTSTSATNCISYSGTTHPGSGRYDPNGHGTHVAGIIAASGNGIRGVTPNVKIMPVRVLGPSGTGETFDVACGIKWATDNGAQVINLSLGSDAASASVSSAISYALENNVVVVAATGNTGTNTPIYPASDEGVIGVGSTDSDGQWSSFSTFGSFVDLVAPGRGIVSTCSAPYSEIIFGGKRYTTACDNTDSDPHYQSLSGTSMATPHVSAVAAIILSQYPTLSPTGVLQLLQESSGDGLGVRIDDKLGYGLVNAAAVLPVGNTRAQVAALANEAARVEAARVAAAQAAAAEAARVAAKQAAAAEAARVAASVSLAKRSLAVKALSNSRISVKVQAPKGSKTIIQIRSGSTWKNVTTRNTTASSTINVSRAGTYRVQIKISNKLVTSKSFSVAASVSLAKRSLAVKALSNSRISVKVQAPKGSKTIVQVRTGNTWKNQTVRNTNASSTINVSRAGTYRVQIKISNKLVTSKSFRVR
jgi:subtilisin family serine protease